MNENNNIKVLDEVCKGVKMGMSAIDFIEDKIEDPLFTSAVKHEYSMYNNILTNVKRVYSYYHEDPKNENLKDKAFLWYGIQMNTIKDSTTSKLAELLMQGTNMGIIEGRRLINNNPKLDSNVNGVLNDFVSFQEESVERLKRYL